MNEIEFTIRAYTKAEFAGLYFMNWRTIKAAILENNEFLFEEINTKKIILTPRIVKQIVEILGEP